MSADLDAAYAGYGRALAEAETRGHRDTERREMAAELRVRRERERVLRDRIGRLEREVVALRRRVFAQGQMG